MYTEERYIIHVKDRSSVGVGFPKPFYNESDFMDYEDEVWCFKSPDFIIRKRIAYNTNADSIVINYARKRSWSISVSDLSDTWKAQRVLAKVSGKPWGTEHVISAVRQVFESILCGTPICRCFDGPEPYIHKARRGA